MLRDIRRNKKAQEQPNGFCGIGGIGGENGVQENLPGIGGNKKRTPSYSEKHEVQSHNFNRWPKSFRINQIEKGRVALNQVLIVARSH